MLSPVRREFDSLRAKAEARSSLNDEDERLVGRTTRRVGLLRVVVQVD